MACYTCSYIAFGTIGLCCMLDAIFYAYRSRKHGFQPGKDFLLSITGKGTQAAKKETII